MGRTSDRFGRDRSLRQLLGCCVTRNLRVECRCYACCMGYDNFYSAIQRRDTLAIHAKLDELLRSHDQARSELAQLDEEEPEDIEEHRRSERRRD